MTKDEMIDGLKAGRTLCQDGSATEAERRAVAELEAAGLVTVELEVVEEQYSRNRIRWRPDGELAAKYREPGAVAAALVR